MWRIEKPHICYADTGHPRLLLISHLRKTRRYGAPVICCPSGLRESLLNGLDDCIVHPRAHALYLLRTAIGPGAVGEQHHGKPARGIAPQRGAGVAEVSKRRRRKPRSRLRWRRRRIPAERARCPGRSRLPPGEQPNSLRPQDGRSAGPRSRGAGCFLRWHS